MNLEKNIGENNYQHIYVFGCSHSLSTNSIDDTCKSYSELIAEKIGVSPKNVYNYSINGSSNFENLYYLNCLDSELKFYHAMSDTHFQRHNEKLPNVIYDNSLIIFQMTYWHRNTLQHTTDKKNGFYKLIPLSQGRQFEDEDITRFNQIYFKKLSNTIFLQRNSLIPIYYTLKGIETERNNVTTILMSWDTLIDDNIKKYVPSELTNLHQISIDNKWNCDSELNNNDLHKSPAGHNQFSEYLLKFI